MFSFTEFIVEQAKTKSKIKDRYETISLIVFDHLLKTLVYEDKDNYDGTPLKTPKDEKKLLLYIKAFLEDISQRISKGELNFKEDFRRYLEDIRNL